MRDERLACVLVLMACSPQTTSDASVQMVAMAAAAKPQDVHDLERETALTNCQFDRMTRPTFDKQRLTSGIYTTAAQMQGVHGAILIKCHVAADGVVSRCVALKALPVVTEPLIARLQATRVQPSTFDGQPIEIDYVFNFHFTLPRLPDGASLP